MGPGWRDVPKPPRRDPEPSWFKRLSQNRTTSPKTQASPTANWGLYSLIGSVVIAFAVWLCLSSLWPAETNNLWDIRLGLALLAGVAAFFWLFWRNPASSMRRAFIGSCFVTVSALVASIAVPSGLTLFGVTITWFNNPILAIVTILALLAINGLLFLAQRQ